MTNRDDDSGESQDDNREDSGTANAEGAGGALDPARKKRRRRGRGGRDGAREGGGASSGSGGGHEPTHARMESITAGTPAAAEAPVKTQQAPRSERGERHDRGGNRPGKQGGQSQGGRPQGQPQQQKQPQGAKSQGAKPQAQQNQNRGGQQQKAQQGHAGGQQRPAKNESTKPASAAPRNPRNSLVDDSWTLDEPEVAAKPAIHFDADRDEAVDPKNLDSSPSSWGSDAEQDADNNSAVAPVTLSSPFPVDDGAYEPMFEQVFSVPPTATHATVMVRFAAVGRTLECEAGMLALQPGQEVVVEFERGPRVGTVLSYATKKASKERPPGQVKRVATHDDITREGSRKDQIADVFAMARSLATSLRVEGKVYRVEGAPGRWVIYYTSENRIDMREFAARLGSQTKSRIELRQLGVRDEAKVVGGIGSCGETLCCTTWLPDFVPVSIKMAKDQGMVLTPQKVSGQCGRLKCCLVYEQAGYTEMRKGLPRLGKRVVTARGEGRVIEVDVLRQRVRVSYGAGEAEVLPATEVKAMFPSQQPGARNAGGADGGDSDEGGDGGDDQDNNDESLNVLA